MKQKFPDDILENRFIPPKNWNQQFFENSETEHIISSSTLLCSSNNYNLVILPGLSEFAEKYIETADYFFKKGFNIHIIDWVYQGRSKRYTPNSHKRHSDGYDADISDLNFFIENFIDTNKDTYFLGHSMGAHIGLRYLINNNHNIKAAAFSAPMLRIKSLNYVEKIYFKILTHLPHFNGRYVPGGKDWSPQNRNIINKDIYSSDPTRKKLHHLWSKHVPELRLGNPTLKWVQESLKSIFILTGEYKNIKAPIFIAAAGNELLVDNKEIKKAAQMIPNATLKILNNSKHEIMMETDEIRDVFLSEALKLFQKHT